MPCAPRICASRGIKNFQSPINSPGESFPGKLNFQSRPPQINPPSPLAAQQVRAVPAKGKKKENIEKVLANARAQEKFYACWHTGVRV